MKIGAYPNWWHHFTGVVREANDTWADAAAMPDPLLVDTWESPDHWPPKPCAYYGSGTGNVGQWRGAYYDYNPDIDLVSLASAWAFDVPAIEAGMRSFSATLRNRALAFQASCTYDSPLPVMKVMAAQDIVDPDDWTWVHGTGQLDPAMLNDAIYLRTADSNWLRYLTGSGRRMPARPFDLSGAVELATIDWATYEWITTGWDGTEGNWASIPISDELLAEALVGGKWLVITCADVNSMAGTQCGPSDSYWARSWGLTVPTLVYDAPPSFTGWGIPLVGVPLS